MKGEGNKQGGIVIFDKTGNVRFTYLELTGEEIPVEDIREVVKGMKESGGR